MSEQTTTLSPQNIRLKKQLQELGATPFYEKCLTHSDTGAHGRVVLPKAVAETQFAQFLEKQGAPLSGEDVDGQTYDFKFRFWTNNQSRMYLIEGCAELLRKYRLQYGDVIVFARKADGTLVLGGRPAGPEDASKRPAVRQRSKPGEERPSKPYKRKKDGTATVADGAFRPCPGLDPSKRVFPEGNNWAAVIDICGETFKAVYNLQSDAWAAYMAVCPIEEDEPQVMQCLMQWRQAQMGAEAAMPALQQPLGTAVQQPMGAALQPPLMPCDPQAMVAPAVAAPAVGAPAVAPPEVSTPAVAPPTAAVAAAAVAAPAVAAPAMAAPGVAAQAMAAPSMAAHSMAAPAVAAPAESAAESALGSGDVTGMLM